MKELSDIEEKVLSAEVCPYCLGETMYFTIHVEYMGRSVKYFKCRPCDAWVACDEKDNPKGRLANKELRDERSKFSRISKRFWSHPASKKVKKHKKYPLKWNQRQVTYALLSEEMNKPNIAISKLNIKEVEKCSAILLKAMRENGGRKKIRKSILVSRKLNSNNNNAKNKQR